MTATFTQQLADYVCAENIERIDQPALIRAKQIITYHISLALRAVQSKNPESLQAVELGKCLSENCGTATVIGETDRVTLVDAVFANCSLMRSLGLDDVIFPAGIHAGLMTVPIALGIAERERASGADVISAVVSGYEVMGKFGLFTWGFDPPRRPTQAFGSFGAITAAGKLLQLEQRQLVVALAYAAHTAMGLAENDRGPVSHWYGLICRNAVIGAYAARADAWGSPTVIEGKYGFIDTFLGGRGFDADAIAKRLGTDYSVMESCEKRYPGTALNQVPIELMRKLVIDDGIRAADLEDIRIVFPVERKKFDAGHELGAFKNPGLAASSFAYQCAMLLLDGKLDPDRYEQTDNPDILTLLEKMSVHFVPDKPIRYTRIELKAKSGKLFVEEADDFKFAPNQTRLLIERDAESVLPQNSIHELIDMLDNLEHLDDISKLTKCLAP